ncbi:hypothetical protein Q8F55_004775 [Vanrija albida]|uniref:Uncharacterized protein n=1 Tax=Vanrija albida TaxID=181172 RepID=A0ABR3PZS0_9TREE
MTAVLLDQPDTNTGESVRDPVPTYSAIDSLDDLDSRAAELGFPLTRYPARAANTPFWDDTNRDRAKIVTAFHDAVEKKQHDAVAQFVARGIVSPDATRWDGPTPLQVATTMGDAKLVQLLVSLGAEVNALHTVPTYFECADADIWGRMPDDGTETSTNSNFPKRHWSYQLSGEEAPRTALMIAAARGNLAMTRLLLSLGADDAVTAPDGQIALRLAASNSHRDIVDLLPARRGGALLRWKANNARALKAIGKALRNCGLFIFGIPYYTALLAYHGTKDLIVKPLYRGAKYVWKERRGILASCARGLRAVPRRVYKMGVDGSRAAVCLVKQVPKLAGDTVDAVVWCAVKTWGILRAVPGVVVSVLRATPRAVGIVAKWAWETVKVLAAALGRVPAAIVSAAHTVAVAIGSAFKRVNLVAVGRALAAIPRAVLELPAVLWRAVVALGHAARHVLKALFGVAGEVVWAIGWVVNWLVFYLPKQILKIVGKILGTVGNAFHEILVFFDPKRIG